MPRPLRVALFSDSYYELNGVGTVSREFAAFAKRREFPFLKVHSGVSTNTSHEGSVTTMELKRGYAFPLDKDLYCDPFLNRYRNHVLRQLREFQPDVIHITGPGDMGVLGFWVSNLLGVPMAASWHTNLHEYAGRRTFKTFGAFPAAFRDKAAATAEDLSLRACMAFYKLAHFHVAPNQDMVEVLAKHTGRPAYKMEHGVDTTRFSAALRRTNGKFCIGWVGRLTPEKNVRAFAEIESRLLAAGENNFKMLLVGDGSERDWLRLNLRNASMPGFLQGEALSQAFAGMDAFVFPSRTDTFGLVILEAMASGVPVVLTKEAGQRVGIEHGVQGYLSEDFSDGVLRLMRSPELRESMRGKAEEFAKQRTWDGVFDDLYGIYREALQHPQVKARIRPPKPVR